MINMKWLKRLRVKSRIKKGSIRLNLGAGGMVYPGWVSTDIDTLNLLNRDEWIALVQPGSVENMLSEHVWEHLTLSAGTVAARNCFEFLRPGGKMRLAVPDGFNPDKNYHEHVRPGGTGPGADDHKLLYNHATLSSVFQSAGFNIILLEYWDENGTFHAVDWDPAEGMIRRSKRFDSRNAGGVLKYTSLIIDAVKP